MLCYKSVTIPKGVTYLGFYAFKGCSKLDNVAISYGLDRLYNGTFWDCSSMTSISIPKSMKTISDSCFINCGNINDVYYIGRTSDWSDIIIYGNNNSNLTNANIHYLLDDTIFTASTRSTDTWNHTFGGEYHYWEFTPSASGTYVFESTLSSGDSYGYVYDSDFNQLYRNDDDGDGNNFLITFNAEAGTTYYLADRWYNSSTTGSIPVKLSRLYTITYDANGGTGAPPPQYKKYGETITIPSTTPTREGYNFLGWATSSTATTARYRGGDNFSLNGNYTLYAVWQAITYTISYDANGGTGAPGDDIYIIGETGTISSTLPTRFGYTFRGWSASSNASWLTDALYKPKDSYNGSDVKLYACWDKYHDITLAHDLYPDCYNEDFVSRITIANTMKYCRFIPTVSGVYTLYTQGSNDTYGYLYDTNGNQITQDDDSGEGSNFKITYNLTKGTTYYYGVKYCNNTKIGMIDTYFARQYTITYNANGGSGAPKQQAKYDGYDIELSDIEPVKDGYNFVGWSTSAMSTEADYAAGSTFDLDADTTLYAVWSQIPTVSAPVIESASRYSLNTGVGGYNIVIRCATDDAVIYYTTDGSEPDRTSSTYNGAFKADTLGTTTIRAIAVKEGYLDSAVSTRDFKVLKCEIPSASVPSGAVTSGTTVELSSAYDDDISTDIYYTTDGSTPRIYGGQEYTEPITIKPPMTIKAIVRCGGYYASDVAEFTYTEPQLKQPSYIWTEYLGKKEITLIPPVEGADIYYSIRGNGGIRVDKTKYTEPIILDKIGDHVIYMTAEMEGYEASDERSIGFHVYQTSVPTASIPSGEVQKGTSVELSCDSGAIIYYTADGTEPSVESIPYTNPISIDGSTTIKAIAVGLGTAFSDVAEFTYTIPAAETPLITTEPIAGGKIVAITSSTNDADIFYTTDGNPLTANSTKYTAPIEFKSAGIYTVKAIAAKDGLLDSTVSEATVDVQKVSAPVSSVASETVIELGTEIALSSETIGAKIYYTTDETEEMKEYTTPITASESLHIRAIARLNGYADSDTVSLSYTIIGTTAAVNINIINIAGGKSVILSSTTPNARIYYTLDSSTPTEDSKLYTEPISITTAGMKIIKAFAVSDSSTPSIVTSDTILTEKLSAPRISPEGGRIPKGTMISLNTAGESADIYYTTDGTEPTEESTRYDAPITLEQSVTIKAVSIRLGYVSSDVSEAEYTVFEKCALPVIDIKENQGVKTVGISCATENADIYYTTDGSKPTSSSTRYTSPIVFNEPISTEIKAIAVRSGYEDSDVASREITVIKTQKPSASVKNGVVKKGTELEFSGEGTIYYSINGGSEQVYTESIIIDNDMTIKAYAISVGSLRSDMLECEYTVEKITSGTAGSAIFWRFVDGELIISGSGAMPDFSAYEAPWQHLKNEIVKITVEQDITVIGNNAFNGLDKVQSVNLPSGLRQINNSAFEGCSRLEAIEFPDGLIGIGENAFKDCVGLKSVTIPNSLVSIGSGAFEGCSSLAEITLPFIGSQVGSANNKDTFDYIFNGNVPETLKWVTITNETNVPENAFKDLSHIENISVNNDVATIGNGAFSGCSSLTGFEIPDGVKAIGDETFKGCENAVTITVPNTVKEIGEAAFDGCKKLMEINVPDGIRYIYRYTFRDCASLTKIEIPTSVISIEEGILSGCIKLVDIKVPFVGANANPGATAVTPEGVFGYFFDGDNTAVPASVTKVEITSTDRNGYIPKEAFKNCGNIVDIMIDGGRNVLDGAFANCKNLKNLYIPKSISSIGSNILEGCTRLETLTVPFVGTNRNDQNKDTSVLGGFFGYDDADITGTIQYYNENGDYHYYKVPRTLKSVSLLNQTTIPAGAFSECDFLEKVAIVTGATMNKYAFYHCASLKSVTLPNDLQTIGYQAFAECEALESVNIPTKVKTIGEQAFYNARALRNITMPDSVTEIADDVFNGTDLFGENAVNLMASGNGVITCSKDSDAYKYAISKGIKTNVVSSNELEIRKTSTTVTLLSDNSYLFDITDSYNMGGVLHVELYDNNSNKLTERTRTANDVEYRIEFTEAEMASVSYAKIYISDASGATVSTEDELISVDGGEIPTEPKSDIEMTYRNGTVRFTGTAAIKAGTVLIEAIYNNNVLSKVNTYPINDISETVTVSSDFEGGSTKYMLWNSLEKMQPLVEAITN